MKDQIRKTFVRQHDQSDCGVACLASIINFFGGDFTLEKLRQLSGTTKQGTTMLGLLEASHKCGFEVEGFEAEGIENLQELAVPAILHVLIAGRLQHYVVFYGFQNDKIILGDPGRGIMLIRGDELTSIWKSKTLLVLKPDQSFKKKNDVAIEKRKWMLSILRQDFNIFLVSLFLGVALAMTGLSTAIFSQKLIDHILPTGDVEKLILSIVLVACILFARIGLSFLRGLFLIRHINDFNNRVIASFYSTLLRLPKSFFDTRKTGDMIARMNDTRRIQTVISSLSGNIVIDFLGLLTSLIFLFVYSWEIGLFMLFSIPVYGYLIWRFNSPILKRQKDVMAGYSLTESNYVDTIQGIGSIKAANSEPFFERLNGTIYGLFQKRVFDLNRLGLRFSTCSEAIGVLFTLGVFSISSWMVLREKSQVGELVALLSMAGGVTPALTRLVVTNIQLKEASIAFERLFEFASIKPEYEQLESSKKLDEISSIELESVSFRFPGQKQIVRNISLTIERGEMIALLGESGGGKSTIIQLLQKFYTPQQGRILVNGEDSKNVHTPILRKHIGVVPQEIKIFNGTLLYNIALSDQQEDFKKAILFCQSSGLSTYFENMPQGYMTLVGEEGINLSGGQKQLVAIARAMWRKPSILLLDEATSALDRKTERVIIQLLERWKNDTGILLVTHKPVTASRATRIYILDGGIIAKEGTPRELLKCGNFFSDSLLEFSPSTI